MRLNFLAATAMCVLLAACGGAKSSQANNVQANMSGSAQVADNAAGSAVAPANGMAMLGGPLSKDQALAVMHQRHEGMETIGKTTKAIKRALDSDPADLATVRAGAAQIADLSRKASGWFPAGTGPDLGKTGAKPEIWQTPDDFTAKLHNFQGAAKAFNMAAMSGDAAATKAKFGELGQACKACHDKYRAEMHH
jgi:cytochrome c556